MSRLIRGRKGKGPDPPPPPVPDNLKSIATARIIDVVSEGPIVGLVNGAQSVFFNNTPLEDTQGASNLEGVAYEERLGLPTQIPFSGFPGVEKEVADGVEVKFERPVVRSIIDTDVDAVRVKLRWPAILSVNLDNGSVGETSIIIYLDRREAGGDWEQVTADLVTGKASSPYERAYRINKPAGATGTWEFRVSKGTEDGDNISIQNQTYLGTYTEIIDVKLEYPDTAAYSYQIDASLFGTSIPARGVEVYGRIIKVPSNYYPTGRLQSNLLLWSEELNQTGWIQSDIDITSNAAQDPDGNMTFDTVTAVSVLAQHVLKQELSGGAAGAGEQFTFSFYVKKKDVIPGIDWVRLQFEGTAFSPPKYVYFNIDAGTVGTVVNSPDNYGIKDEGGGIYRCWITSTTDQAGTVRPSLYLQQSDGETAAWLPGGIEGMHAGWAQLDRIEQVGDYVKSEGTQGTITGVARSYWGIWDGTFRLDWSDNPAWVMYDMLTNTRYGLGQAIAEARVDKWTLFTIAQYCDGLVPDGDGGLEPRFTFNGVIQSADEAYNVINYMASVFRGMVYWSSALVSFSQDAPADPVGLVTPSNVIKGEITYSGTSLKSKVSAVAVTWNDPSQLYVPAIELVEDQALIERYGWRDAQVVALWTTSRGQANRLGRWILYAPDEIATWRQSFDGEARRPGQIVEVADPSYAGTRMGGRTAAGSTTTVINLDDTITISAGETYALSVVLPDGSLETSVVTDAPGSYTSLTLQTALSVAPVDGAEWVLTASNLAPRPFRIVSVSELEPGAFEVTAVQYDPNLEALIEEGINLPPLDYTILPSGPIPSPTGLFGEETALKVGPNIRVAVILSWEPVKDSRVSTYEVEVMYSDAGAFRFWEQVDENSSTVFDTPDGTTHFRVRAKDAVGNTSAWAIYTKDVKINSRALPAITSFTLSIVDNQVVLNWSPIDDILLDHYEIRHSTDLTTPTWALGQTLIQRASKDATSAVVSLLAGSYMIRGFGIGDQLSPVSFASLSQGRINPPNVIEVLQQHPGFAGTKVSVFVNDQGQLQLGSTQVMSDWGKLADVTSLTMGTLEGVETEGTYFFDQQIDLTDVFTSRVSADLKGGALNLNNFMSSWDRLADVANLSGVPDSEVTTLIEMRHTPDDPAGAPVWSPWEALVVGDHEFRAAEFRAKLFSSDPTYTPVVDELSVTVDMPDRVFGVEDVVAPAIGLSYSYPIAFKAVPSLVITPQDMQTGDYYTITSSTATGFSLQFFNSADVGIQRTFDFVASGYGRVTPP